MQSHGQSNVSRCLTCEGYRKPSPVRNLMISHWNFHWVLCICMDFAWISSYTYEYVFDYWRVYQNDTSLHWFRLLPWKFVSTQRPEIWQQTCEFHPIKSTNNGDLPLHIYIYYILSLMFWSTNRRAFHQRQRDFAMLCHALPCFGFHDLVNDFVRGWHLCRGPHTFRGIECCCWLAIMASRGVTVPISHILAIYEQYGWLMMVNDGWLTIWWWMMVNDGEWWLYILYIYIY